jgi:hypothetical protein
MYSEKMASFEGNTKVLTKDGLKNIKDVGLGDLVFTHKKRWMPIEKVGMLPFQEINEVRCLDETVILCNDTTKFLTMALEDGLHYSNPTLKNLSQLSYSDYLVGENTLKCSIVTSKANLKYDTRMYCIEVKDDHSFLANGKFVQSC